MLQRVEDEEEVVLEYLELLPGVLGLHVLHCERVQVEVLLRWRSMAALSAFSTLIHTGWSGRS